MVESRQINTAPKLRTRRYLLASGIMLLTGVACRPTPPEDTRGTRDQAMKLAQGILEEKGLMGEHPIVDLRSVPGFSARGDIGGGIIVFTGTFEGETTSMVQFAWRTAEKRNPQIVISELPFSRVIFNLLDDIQEPTVNFNLASKDVINFSGLSTYAPLVSQNPNAYVRRSTLTAFSLSERDFTNFRVPNSK